MRGRGNRGRGDRGRAHAPEFGGSSRVIPVVEFSQEGFPAPDWKSADWTQFNKNTGGRGYDWLVDRLSNRGTAADAQSMWGANMAFDRRLTTAGYKAAAISPRIAAELRASGELWCDLGCGDGSMGTAFGRMFGRQVHFFDVQNNIPADSGITDFKLMETGGRFEIGGPEIPARKPNVILALHILHHVGGDLEESATRAAAMRSWLQTVRGQVDPGCLVLIREHDCGWSQGSAVKEIVGVAGNDAAVDPGKVGVVCLTHIRYEMDEESTAGIRGSEQAVEWLGRYRLGLTSAENMVALFKTTGFELVEATQPTRTDFSYYALFKAV